MPSPQDRAAVESVDPAPRRGPETALQVAAVVRQHLDPSAGVSSLPGVLARLAGILGYPAAVVLRLVDDRLVPVGQSGFEEPSLPAEIAVEGTIAGAALRDGGPVLVDDAAGDARWIDLSGGRHRSALAVPMRLGTAMWGVLQLECIDACAFDDGVAAALEPVADELAWALEAMRLADGAADQARAEQRLRRGIEATSAVITAGLLEGDLDSALDRMVREVRERLGWPSLAVLLRDGAALEVVASYGYADEMMGRRFSTKRGILGHVAVTGRAHFAPDIGLDPYYEAVLRRTRGEMCAPLKVAGMVRGLVNAETDQVDGFSPHDFDLLSRLADQMSLVLHNFELLRTEKETVERFHELDRFKSRLLTLASHELRTPLTVVLGFAEVMAEHAGTLTPDRMAHYAGSILRHAGSLGKLVDRMLIASEIEQGQLNIVPGRVELADVVGLVTEAYRSAAFDIADGIAESAVRADPVRLRQVLDALVENAVKYAGDGVIQFDARADGRTTTVLLRDEGPGIPGDERERVFELFHQVGEHGVAGRRGVGLGLTIARDLTVLMGGELEMVSAEGYGVTFLLKLPTAG